ncbi:TIR domain-containing protein [Desulfospira joergensenii]|uniref:TIR domain-containing protein n=1 Tax=Desulfospira joergensenii TaxID=53329 RepID=UPI0003B67134|nr:TIR domain-containing protein [Desulfospira joergensenii]
MIVHKVVVGKPPKDRAVKREHKKIYVGCAGSDIRYRDMLVNFRHRWEFYTNPTIDFLTFDRSRAGEKDQNQALEKIIRESDGVMFIVSADTAKDSWAVWEIDCAVSNDVPIVGVDIGKNPEGRIPEKLVGKMTRYGWEWFADFINRL